MAGLTSAGAADCRSLLCESHSVAFVQAVVVSDRMLCLRHIQRVALLSQKITFPQIVFLWTQSALLAAHITCHFVKPVVGVH